MNTVSRRLALPFMLLALLFQAPPVRAQGAGPAPSAESAPPAITIVREGGVADAYRRDGADFAAYGPEGAARVATPQEQVRQALRGAHVVELLSLAVQPGGTACSTDACAAGQRVQASAPMQSRPRRDLVQEVLDAWLGEPTAAASSGEARFSHAVRFDALGHAWAVLLCFECGRYAILRDGVEIGAGRSERTPGLASLDAVLAGAAP
jgi:hypothetical protein